MRMLLPKGSRRAQSIPYGRSVGSSVNSTVGLPQQEHSALDAAALQVAVRRFAERSPERAREMRLRHMGDPGHGRDVQRLRVSAVHRVPGPEHPAVGLFDGAAHDAITPQFLPRQDSR